MGSLERNMRRHVQNQRTIAQARQECDIRAGVCSALAELAQAEGYDTEVEAMSLNEYDDLLGLATHLVQFTGDADQRASPARELSPAWLRGFTVIPPTPDEDDEDEYADDPRQLVHGWAERKIFRQVLAQATDYEGELTPTSFDLGWICGMRNRAIQEEVVEKKKPVQLAVRRSHRGWTVYFRAARLFSQAQAAFDAVFEENFLKDELDAALAALLPLVRAIGVLVYGEDQLAERIERQSVGLVTRGICSRMIQRTRKLLLLPPFPSRTACQEAHERVERAMAEAIDAVAAEPDLVHHHAQCFTSRGRTLGERINQPELEELVRQLDGAYALVNAAKSRCREALAPVNELKSALESQLQ